MKRTILIIGLILFTTAATAQISQTRGSNGGLLYQDSSSNTLLNISESGDLEVSGELKGVSTGGSASGLSEVLEVNSTANQSIEFSDGIIVGSGVSNNDKDIVIGSQAQANNQNINDDSVAGIAIGDNTLVNYTDSIALGSESAATGTGSLAIGANADAAGGPGGPTVAIGPNAETTGARRELAVGEMASASGIRSVALGASSKTQARDSIAIGWESTAQADGSIAFGRDSLAPNSYEATFGNLNDRQMDLNVTGNATIHENTDIKGDLNVGGELTGVSTGGSASGLSEVLEVNNTANQSIDMPKGVDIGDDTTSVSSSSDVAIGGGADAGGLSVAVGDGSESANQATALGPASAANSQKAIGVGQGSTASGDNSIAIGTDGDSGTDGAEASGSNSLAMGTESQSSSSISAALGAYSEASAQGAVAIGPYSESNNRYETTFGTLRDDNFRQDINVTGNATIHGSGGLDMPNGIVIGDSISANSADDVAIGDGVSTSATGAMGDPTVNTGVGNDASATGSYSSSIGGSSEASGDYSTALGDNSVASGSFSTALGWDSDATGSGSIAIGGADTTADAAPTASSDYSIALGSDSSASASGAVAIGHQAVSDQSYTARFGSDSQAYDVDVTGDLNVDGYVDSNDYDISYSTGHTAWASGLSTEEVNRWNLQSGEEMVIDRLEVAEKGGGSSNFDVTVTDGTNSWTVDPSGTSVRTGLGPTAEGSSVTVEVTNNDGSDVTASITVSGEVR